MSAPRSDGDPAEPPVRARRAILVSLRPLRASAAARRLFAGLFLSWFARRIPVVAVPLQVYQQTGSSLLVGLLGVAQLIPTLLASFAGGAVADASDRRRLLIRVQAGLAISAGLMWLNAILDQPRLWPLFAVTALNGALLAFDSPARQSALPRIVGMALVTEGVVLMQTLLNIAKALGPLLAGIIIARYSLEVAYGTATLIFLLNTLIVRGLPAIPPKEGARRAGLGSVLEGLRFLRERPVLKANFAIDLNAMIFGMPIALFPAFALEVLDGDASTVGLLHSAIGLGALTSALLSGWVSGVRRPGRAVVIAVLVWGAAITGFGLARTTWLAVILLALAGSADVVSAIFRLSILQHSVPDELRGRLFGINVAVVSGGPQLGDLEAGVVATLAGTQASIVSGGIATLLGAVLVARRVPAYLRPIAGGAA